MAVIVVFKNLNVYSSVSSVNEIALPKQLRGPQTTKKNTKMFSKLKNQDGRCYDMCKKEAHLQFTVLYVYNIYICIMLVYISTYATVYRRCLSWLLTSCNCCQCLLHLPTRFASRTESGQDMTKICTDCVFITKEFLHDQPGILLAFVGSNEEQILGSARWRFQSML